MLGSEHIHVFDIMKLDLPLLLGRPVIILLCGPSIVRDMALTIIPYSTLGFRSPRVYCVIPQAETFTTETSESETNEL